MNCAAIQAVLTHSRSANAARMVLIVLAARSGDKGQVINLPISDICRETNASERTVKYAIEELRDELKEITTERDGKGRGKTFDFDLSPLLGRANDEKVQRLHASDKRADVAPIEEKGADVAPNSEKKGANPSEIHAEIAPLSDSKGADFTGTPIAPYKAETITQSTTGAKAPSARARGSEPATELPDWLPVEAWQEWEEHRREIKKPLTALSAKKQLKQLATFRARGMPPEQVIEQAITHGWRGFYELKEPHEATQSGTNGNGNGHGRTTQAGRPDDASRRSTQADRTPPGGWGFKNSARG